MANAISPSPYLAQGFEPIRMEYDYPHLIIEGEVPRDLEGTFYRIGPNPQFAPRGTYNPLNGDGMVHAFHLRDGSVSYRNRWVRTQQWNREHVAGRALFGTSGLPSDSDASVVGMRTDGVANTNLVWHGNKLLALEEGHAPIELDPASLETIGPWSFNHKLPRNMTAHPKIDPESGEMIFFANFPTGRITGDLEFYLANGAGELVRSQMIHGPFPALVHDFALTKDFVVIPMCPVTVSIKRAMAGAPAIAWEPDKGTQVGIITRNGGGGEVRWFSGAACMAWHSMNAFNDGDRIIVDVCQQEAPVFPLADGSPTDSHRHTQLLTRWEFDWSKPGSFAVERLSDERCEYPRIDERRAGHSYRHGYVACLGGPGSGDTFHRGLGHFDHATRKMRIYAAGPRSAVAEPVFVPRNRDAREGEGYLMTNIFDEERNASHLAIFDAEQIERGPIARAHLDHRVPVGFHGYWKSGDSHHAQSTKE
jgi:carotenoid cleavage dioxygenase-like enzyme